MNRLKDRAPIIEIPSKTGEGDRIRTTCYETDNVIKIFERTKAPNVTLMRVDAVSNALQSKPLDRHL